MRRMGDELGGNAICVATGGLADVIAPETALIQHVDADLTLHGLENRVGTQPIDEYCREIETYLCRKNDGHLIRVVGPSFEVVSGWAAQGVPLKIALAGIDRYFERYYRKGPRRRPVKIDFCDADVLDVFDEWRRATGLSQRQSPSHRVCSRAVMQSAVGSRSVPAGAFGARGAAPDIGARGRLAWRRVRRADRSRGAPSSTRRGRRPAVCGARRGRRCSIAWRRSMRS